MHAVQPPAHSVSVILPTYNRVTLLREALQSALAQTHPVYEIIVIDDGSTDATRELVASYGAPVRYRFQTNAGPAAARNAGLRAAQGEYIAFLDSDDIWRPEKLALQVELLRTCPQVDLTFTDMEVIQGGATLRASFIDSCRSRHYLRSHPRHLDGILPWLLRENFIGLPTVVLRRARLGRIGLFHEGLHSVEDREFLLRWADGGIFGFVDRALLLRRLTETSISRDEGLRLTSLLGVLGAWAGNPHVLASRETQRAVMQALARAHYLLGSHYLRRGNWSQARGEFIAERRAGPASLKGVLKLLAASAGSVLTRS